MEEKEKVNLSTVVKRVRSKTPRFWKKIRTYAISLGSSLVAVLLANSQLDLELHPTIITVVKYSVAIMAAIAGTAQLTKE
jgi:hypothetical protein